MEILDKDIIRMEILPYLRTAQRGYKCKSDLSERSSSASCTSSRPAASGISYPPRQSSPIQCSVIKQFSASSGSGAKAVRGRKVRNPSWDTTGTSTTWTAATRWHSVGVRKWEARQTRPPIPPMPYMYLTVRVFLFP